MTKRKVQQSGRYVILQETSDNTYCALGPSFDGFEDLAAADAAAKARRDRFPHQAFVVLQCVARYSHQTRAVVTKMVEAPPRKVSELKVVQFPRSGVSNRG